MTRIESDKVTVNKTSEEIYTFLSNFNNFQKLMPEQVTNWQSTEEDCSFTIAGMASLGMKIVEKIPHTMIKVTRNGKAPFDFNLDCSIKDLAPQCEVQLAFDADLNPMLKMMAVKPLTNFLNLLVHKLNDLP
ncbi:MAG: SRPBCC family protein [Bacteroidetes bacterium]|nr:SRPBCC family protein [Bacteroidota bacterium]MBP6402238.1 SRPBCC family protein [Bacteroidia bacterium]MBK6838127.1 SRPBCC family protein [Bacteroidota bacterium]MBK9525007.1 SRPBCC family protein [Bacteroidota bacterium]MBK9543848.1 SRPBCC family protein [Bacteroidota bacterium]